MAQKKTADASKVYDSSEVMRPEFDLLANPAAASEARDLFTQCFVATPDPVKWHSAIRPEWPKIATISRERIVLYPIHTNPHAQRYLSAQHPPFYSITYIDNSTYELPDDAGGAISQIDMRLPWGLFKDSDRGFGFAKPIEEAWRVLGSAFRSAALTIVPEGETRKDGNNLIVSQKDLDSIRRAANRIDKRKNDGIRREKGAVVFSEILTKLDPERFVVRSQELVEVKRADASKVLHRLSREASQRSVTNIRASLPSLAAQQPDALLKLHSEIERVTLAEMIARYEQHLAKDLSEQKWQSFFTGNRFVLSLAFARPVWLLHTQFHARGSSINGAGAQVGDFLFKELGQGLALVEIKKPGTELVRARPYRNTEVYAPTDDLSGALTQTLLQQSEIRSNWLAHQGNRSLKDSRPESIKCVIVAGRTPTDSAQIRSFELFRNACKDVEILTFDELLAKLRLTLEHLTPKTVVAQELTENDLPF